MSFPALWHGAGLVLLGILASGCLSVPPVAGPAESEAAMNEKSDGGWETAGLPYAAIVSREGYLDALRVGDFDFAAPGKVDLPHGIYLVDGAKPLPFRSVTALDDGFAAENEAGKVTVHFRAEGIEITVHNRSIAAGQCLRMDLSEKVARITVAARGMAYEMPLRAAVVTPARIIAPNGASLSFGKARTYDLHAGGHVLRVGGRHVVKFPHVRAGSTKMFKVAVNATPQPEDALVVAVKMPTPDHAFWSDGPQSMTTGLTGVGPQQGFSGEMVLRVRSYLTKQIVQEMRQKVRVNEGETASLTWELAGLEPMLYIAELYAAAGGREGLCSAPRFVFNAREVLPPAVPEDFDAFWQRTLEEQAQVPLDLQIAKVKEQGDHEVYKFSFAGLLGYRCYGWLTVPKDKSRKWPGVLVLPPAGMRSQPIPIFPRAVGMRININTVDVDLPEHQYDWRTWPAPYLVTGILARDHYCLRFGYAATVRAAEVLAARPEVDPAHVSVTGSSQGGGLTFITAGLYQGFESARAIKPGLCRLDWNLNYLQPPFFPIAVNDYSREEIEATLRYFLPCHFARNITCPISVSLALHDDVTPAVGVFCAYNAIPGTGKKIKVDPHATH